MRRINRKKRMEQVLIRSGTPTPNLGFAEMLERLLKNGYMIGKDGKIISSKDGGYVVSMVGGDEILCATVEEAVKQFGQVV